MPDKFIPVIASRSASFIHKNAIAIMLILVIAVYLYNGIQYIHAQSITYDEGNFYNYAVRYLKGNPDRVNPMTDDSKMPVSVLNTIPRILEQLIEPNSQKTDMGVSDIIHGRYVTLFFSIFILLLIFIWTKQLYGKKGALFAAFLFSFCPNNMALATLVTTDSYSVFFLLLSVYLVWKFCETKNIYVFIFLSFSVAVSQLVKQSLFYLYILVPICLLVYFISFRKAKKDVPWVRLAFLFALINLVVINAGYYFRHSFMRLDEYNFMSNLFLTLQKTLPGSLPMPFPKPFVDGLDMGKYYDQIGGGIDTVSGYGKVTILGKSFTGRGIWYYYFISLLFKTPISYFLFLIVSLFSFVKNGSLSLFMKNQFFLIIPVLYFLIILSFFYQAQCGIRHIIFIYPFFFIFSGSVIANAKSHFQKSIAFFGSIFLIISVMKYYNNYYPYTNELIEDKKTANRYVGASNLNFGHGDLFCKKYLQEHKDVKWVTERPTVGVFLITVDDYMDIWNRHQYDWITSLKPVGHVAHCALLIRVTERDIKK